MVVVELASPIMSIKLLVQIQLHYFKEVKMKFKYYIFAAKYSTKNVCDLFTLGFDFVSV